MVLFDNNLVKTLQSDRSITTSGILCEIMTLITTNIAHASFNYLDFNWVPFNNDNTHDNVKEIIYVCYSMSINSSELFLTHFWIKEKREVVTDPSQPRRR